MKYTVEEVRTQSGVTDAVVQRAEQAFWPAYTECTRVHGARKNAHATGMRAALLAVWPNPPAQAAQVDQVGELLAIIHGDGGHYQAEHGLQKAAKDAQEKVIQMMTKIATAEPVAQDDCPVCGCVHDGQCLCTRPNAVSIVFNSQEAADRFYARMDEAMKVAQNTASPINLAAVREVPVGEVIEIEETVGFGQKRKALTIRWMVDSRPAVGTKLFAHPPAQVAQADPVVKPHTLADFVHASDAERVQIGQQVAARVDEMMAEPVTQDEVDWIAALRKELLHSKMTHNFTFTRDEVMQLIGDPFPQPAQSVDVEKVRRVAADIRHWNEAICHPALNVFADELEAAVEQVNTHLSENTHDHA